MNKYDYRKWCYCVQRANGDIKIGFTTFMGNRLYRIKWQHGDIVVLGVFPGSMDDEQRVQNMFSEHRLYANAGWHGCVSLKTDWFKCTPELLAWIEANTEVYEPPPGNVNSKSPMKVASRPFHKQDSPAPAPAPITLSVPLLPARIEEAA